MTKRNPILKSVGIKSTALLTVGLLIVSIGTQRLVAQTNLGSLASTSLATSDEQGVLRLKGAIVKAPPSIKVPGLRDGLLVSVTVQELSLIHISEPTRPY